MVSERFRLDDLTLDLSNDGICRAHDKLLLLFERCPAGTAEVWEMWNRYEQKGGLDTRDLIRLSDLSRSLTSHPWDQSCPCCRHHVGRLPWSERPDRLTPPRTGRGLQFVPRRLLGTLLLLPVLMVVPLCTGLVHLVRLSLFPNLITSGTAYSWRDRLWRAAQFVFYQDISVRHLGAALGVCLSYLAVGYYLLSF
ncbi:MAG: hypothetical protein AB7S38_30875 [Vulcanimicrobiota bacterium]